MVRRNRRRGRDERPPARPQPMPPGELEQPLAELPDPVPLAEPEPGPPAEWEAQPAAEQEPPQPAEREAPPADEQDAQPPAEQEPPQPAEREAPPADEQDAQPPAEQELPQPAEQEAPPADEEEAPPPAEREAPPPAEPFIRPFVHRHNPGGEVAPSQWFRGQSVRRQRVLRRSPYTQSSSGVRTRSQTGVLAFTIAEMLSQSNPLPGTRIRANAAALRAARQEIRAPVVRRQQQERSQAEALKRAISEMKDQTNNSSSDDDTAGPSK